MTALKKESLNYFLRFCLILVILGLSAFCLKLYSRKQKVLGAQTEIEAEVEREKAFWEEFLSKNPGYSPGWREIGRLNRIYQINSDLVH